MTKPLNRKSRMATIRPVIRFRRRPWRLLLQRFDAPTNAWQTVNDLTVTPFTDQGAADCYAELERQQTRWDSNYRQFFGSTWRIRPVYQA